MPVADSSTPATTLAVSEEDSKGCAYLQDLRDANMDPSEEPIYFASSFGAVVKYLPLCCGFEGVFVCVQLRWRGSGKETPSGTSTRRRHWAKPENERGLDPLVGGGYTRAAAAQLIMISHKTKAKVPTLVVGGTSTRDSFRSADDRRMRTKIGVLDDTAAVAGEPTRWYQEDLATSAARMDPEFTYQLGDSFSCEVDNAVDDGIEVVLGPAPTTRFPNADRPLKAWYPHCDDYVHEQLRREGRGTANVYARCIVAAHAQLPTHFIEHWNGTHFVRARTALRDLGLRMQLNHLPGRGWDGGGGRAFRAQNTVVARVLVAGDGALTKTCATFSVLRQFQALNCFGKLSAYDFLRGLEKCTNHDGLDKPPDRRKPFMHVVRQWREVKRMKRFKRGHDEGGVRGTKQGELALMCRACPQPGWNLPEGWEKINPLYRFIYWLFLAQDANFRLSNRTVSSEVADPILGDGFGFFCKREGPDGYKAHIAKNVDEAEISNCSGFQAMFMANTKRTKGLRTTGVGGVTCSRHNMWRGNGIGDLQVGEKYCNMDFLLLSVLFYFRLLCVVVSYDIACQYAANFWNRMAKMGQEWWLALSEDNVLWKRIHKFRQIQGVYMPALRAQLSNAQKEMYDGSGDQQPEATRLFMLSELPVAVRAGACALGVPEIEARLRYGEAREALNGVRHGLRTRTMTNRYKLRNFTGQGLMTKGQGMLRQINIKIHTAKVRYRYARAALLALRGHGDWEEQLRVLGDNDVWALNERALTTEEEAQNDHWAELGSAFIEGGVARAAGLAAGEGSHTLSWIWYTIGATYDEKNPDPKLHDALRLEWSKAYARTKRLSEEVRLLREEMRRTIAFGRTAAEKWQQLAEQEIAGSTPELTEGRRAYAAEHAATECQTCAKLERNWAGILAKADVYLEGTADLDAESLVTIELELGDELDPEDEEARLEAEED
ncbi:hypothetical protein K438DRAFT_1789652 [Mycena galopus ATCC 62051]|nr:hypothetical protein K438DRAFT_1789652 [Mycena galopus ATCC 62051]